MKRQGRPAGFFYIDAEDNDGEANVREEYEADESSVAEQSVRANIL